MASSPALLAIRAMSWDQYKTSQLPALNINGKAYPYFTFAGIKVPAAVFDLSAKAARVGWDQTDTPLLYGYWNKRQYQVVPFSWSQLPHQQRTLVSATPQVSDITGLNADTWLDKIGFTGALIGVTAGFGAAFGAIADAAVSGTALASGAEVSAAAAESAFSASNAARLVASGTGNQDVIQAVGIINKAVSLGADISDNLADTVSTGVAPMDEFGFDSFDFSSGESLVAFSDAENVDFGLGSSTFDFGADTPDFGGQLDGFGDEASNVFGGQVYDFGSTPEVTTNDFGTTFDNSYGASAVNTAVKGVGLAGSVAGVLSKPSTGTVASAGAAGSKAANAGQGADILGGIGSIYRTIVGAAQGVAGQSQQVQQVRYTGQLTPAGGLATAGSSNLILIGGAALVALALFMHAKG